MTAEQFAYWMQGFAELTGDEPPTAGQWKSMKEHLQTVFVKVTPPLQDWRPAVNDPSKAPPIRTTSPVPILPYDWQHPNTGTPPSHLIATCSTGGAAAHAIC
jgi:hypothetical protein